MSVASNVIARDILGVTEIEPQIPTWDDIDPLCPQA